MKQGVKLKINEEAIDDVIKLYDKLEEEMYGRQLTDEEREKIRQEFKKLNENGGLGTLY